MRGSTHGRWDRAVGTPGSGWVISRFKSDISPLSSPYWAVSTTISETYWYRRTYSGIGGYLNLLWRTSGQRSSKVDGNRRWEKTFRQLHFIGHDGTFLCFRIFACQKSNVVSLMEFCVPGQGPMWQYRAYSTCACWWDVSEVGPPSKQFWRGRLLHAVKVCLTIASSLSGTTSSKPSLSYFCYQAHLRCTLMPLCFQNPAYFLSLPSGGYPTSPLPRWQWLWLLSRDHVAVVSPHGGSLLLVSTLPFSCGRDWQSRIRFSSQFFWHGQQPSWYLCCAPVSCLSDFLGGYRYQFPTTAFPAMVGVSCWVSPVNAPAVQFGTHKVFPYLAGTECSVAAVIYNVVQFHNSSNY